MLSALQGQTEGLRLGRWGDGGGGGSLQAVTKGKACITTWIPDMPVSTEAPGPAQDWVLEGKEIMELEDTDHREEGKRKELGALT